MCGIVGIVAADFGGIHPEKANDSLEHRGPDARGTYMTQCQGKTVFLGHRRLSIIDLSDAANQPMRRGAATLVYNGETYNFKQLKRAHLSGRAFATTGDTEVVLELYLKFGPSFLSHLNGDFALGIFDGDKNRLLLARDPLGVKPLYIYRSGPVFAFASEIKAFRAAGLKLSFRREAVSDFLVFKYSPLQTTLFTEVERLKPGTALEYDVGTGREVIHPFWGLEGAVKPFRGNLSRAAGELRERMDHAVKARLIGDVPIANYLSGGVDSSVIASVLRGGDHAHYCAVKSEEDLKAEGTTSDGRYAHELAAAWGLDLRDMPIGADMLTAERIDAAIGAVDELVADGSIIPAMAMAESAAKEHRVVLSGMGADELFFGYNGHYLTRLNSLAPRAAKPALASLMRRVHGNKGRLKAYRRYLQKWGNNAGMDYAVGRFSVVGDVGSALRILNRPGDPGRVFDRYFGRGGEGDDFERLFRFELDNFLVKNLCYLDGASMAHGLESRVPFLDVDVVAFAAGLPSEYKMDKSLHGKKVLKQAYKDVLPPQILKRRKAGFGMPLRSLLADPEKRKPLMPYEFIASTGLFRPGAVEELEAAHMSGRQDHSALLYALICLGRWHRKYFG